MMLYGKLYAACRILTGSYLMHAGPCYDPYMPDNSISLRYAIQTMRKAFGPNVALPPLNSSASLGRPG